MKLDAKPTKINRNGDGTTTIKRRDRLTSTLYISVSGWGIEGLLVQPVVQQAAISARRMHKPYAVGAGSGHHLTDYVLLDRSKFIQLCLYSPVNKGFYPFMLYKTF